jgi:hypothetical protein
MRIKDIIFSSKSVILTILSIVEFNGKNTIILCAPQITYWLSSEKITQLTC